jgi:TolB-like protein/class 3 adenylate cyclase/Tfp pilus assembly protein PilF
MSGVPTSGGSENAVLPRETAARMRFAGLVLDLGACTLARDTGEAIQLTRGEFALLRIFVGRPGRVLSRETILNSIANRNLELFDRSVDVLVSRLRRKIEPDSKKPRLIVTVPGEGYRFDGVSLQFEHEAPRPEQGLESPLPAKAERKLTTVLAADVVGFSKLAGADEERTLARLRAVRSDLIDPTIGLHRGRVVKRAGDGVIVEFRSVVDAVRCAIEVQSAMAVRNAGLPADERIEFRVGIHLGDVVEEADGDLMGDGVNIASRLEGVCEPGGVCLSGAAYEQVRDRVKGTFVDLGEKLLKNIARPVRIYNLPPAQLTSKSAVVDTPPNLALPDKPSIAVLPFQNMSGDTEQDYFADGMVEDIVTGLSRIKWLFVIARNSSFVYKGKAVDVRQIGRELGVRYLLEGGVRKAGARLRITAQLVEAETGAHLWADKFDGGLEDVFELQDQITDRVVGIVEPSLRKSEIDRSRRKRPESLDAYDLYLRSLPHLTPMSPANAEIAAGFLRDALKIDPNFAAAHALLAWAHSIRFLHGGFDEAEKIAGLRHARAAIANDVDDATALAFGGMMVLFLSKDTHSALEAIERALSFNHSSALAYYIGAELYGRSGQPATATTYAQRALRLSPFDPMAHTAHQAFALAAFQEGRYEEAAAWWAKCAHAHPNIGGFAIGQAMALALAGRMDEARPIFARGLELDVRWSIRRISEYGTVPAIADKWVEAARLLGAPE